MQESESEEDVLDEGGDDEDDLEEEHETQVRPEAEPEVKWEWRRRKRLRRRPKAGEVTMFSTSIITLLPEVNIFNDITYEYDEMFYKFFLRTFT